MTVTGPAVAGSIKVTLATPEPLVTAITFDPLNDFSDPTCTFASEPALVVKKTLAPAALPPDCPTPRVTDKFSVVPAAPVWLSPVLLKVAAGLLTTIHPCCVVLSEACTANR